MDSVFGKAKRVVLQLEDELVKLDQSVQAGAAPAEVPAPAVANGDGGPPLSLQGRPAATTIGTTAAAATTFANAPQPVAAGAWAVSAQITSDLTILQRHLRTAESVALREVSSERRMEAREYADHRALGSSSRPLPHAWTHVVFTLVGRPQAAGPAQPGLQHPFNQVCQDQKGPA